MTFGAEKSEERSPTKNEERYGKTAIDNQQSDQKESEHVPSGLPGEKLLLWQKDVIHTQEETKTLVEPLGTACFE